MRSGFTLRRNSMASVPVAPKKENEGRPLRRSTSAALQKRKNSEDEAVGWVTKVGGSVRSWKRRWMVLQGSTIVYYPKPGAKAKGDLVLQSDDSLHLVENSDKSPFMFSINTAKRSYLMYPDTLEERNKWFASINAAIDAVRVANGQAPRVAAAVATVAAADDGDAIPKASLPHGEEETRLRGKLVSLAQSVGLSRQVLVASVSSVSWVAASDMVARCVSLFESRAPAEAPPELSEAEEASWSIRRCDDDFHLVGISAASTAEVMMQRVVDFMYASNVSDVEMKMLELLVNIVKPAVLSLWLDALFPRGGGVPPVFGGYTLPLLDGGDEIVRAIGHQVLIKFFEAHKAVLSVSSVSRNCSECQKYFAVTFRFAASQTEMLYSFFEGFMPLPISVVKELRIDKSLRGDWLRVMFADDGSVSTIEISVPKAEDDFLSSVLGSKCNVVVFRASSNGGSANVREWRGVYTHRTI